MAFQDISRRTTKVLERKNASCLRQPDLVLGELIAVLGSSILFYNYFKEFVFHNIIVQNLQFKNLICLI